MPAQPFTASQNDIPSSSHSSEPLSQLSSWSRAECAVCLLGLCWRRRWTGSKETRRILCRRAGPLVKETGSILSCAGALVKEPRSVLRRRALVKPAGRVHGGWRLEGVRHTCDAARLDSLLHAKSLLVMTQFEGNKQKQAQVVSPTARNALENPLDAAPNHSGAYLSRNPIPVHSAIGETWARRPVILHASGRCWQTANTRKHLNPTAGPCALCSCRCLSCAQMLACS